MATGKKKLILCPVSVSHASVLLLMIDCVINIVKVAVEP